MTFLIVSGGSLTRTTPPWPVQYFVPAASIDITRSVVGASSASRADATCWNLARLSDQTPWTNADPMSAAPAAKTTAAPVNARVAVRASQLGRRAATQATATAMPSRPRTYECGASATAEWMKVPPGTCTALTNAENA